MEQQKRQRVIAKGHPSKGPRTIAKKARGSPIKRTEVKRKFSCGPENQVFSPREKPLQNRRKAKGSPIKRIEVKRKFSCGPENQVFSPREKPLDNTPDFFAFCLSRNISLTMSAHFAAPVTHQDLGRRSSPTVLRRPDNLRSHAMSKEAKGSRSKGVKSSFGYCLSSIQFSESFQPPLLPVSAIPVTLATVLATELL